MKKMHAKRSWIFFMVLALVLVLGKTPVFAESVRDFAELKKAVEKGENSITITGNITVTETLEIKKDVVISGNPKNRPKIKLADGFSEDQMFKVNEGKSLTLNDIILDGNKRGRLINVKGGTVNLKMADLQNGSTEFIEQNASNDQNFSGGAILATKGEKLGSTVTIKKGFFVNNNTGSKALSKDRYAEGGAIKIEDSTLTIDGTFFTDNHLDSSATEGGRQGGAIEATQTNVEIANANFFILGPFNTGGGIKFENCPDASVKNSTFTLRSGKGTVGVAGGAITSEGSYLTIDNSTFNTGKGSYVQESGGLIQVVGTGEFHLKNSTLNGSGVGWNKTGENKTAKYGGAIVFYDKSTVKATIENTTIQNFTAEISGGGIALNTQVGKSGGTNLTLIDTKILNNVTYAWNMTAYGGGIFAGKGNTVTLEGGQISSDQYSSVGGAIYNEGKLTLTGTAENPAKIINNKAYHMAAGVLNDGELTVDYATFSGNVKGDGYTGNGHVYDKNTDKDKRELSGVNIYAVKDVTITPNAYFDNKDVRILDGQSSIILTGALPDDRHINVSISETPKKQGEATQNKPEYPLHPKFNETQNRKVGYLIAKGNGNYTPTASDAKALNYVSNDTSQDVASADDHTSIGEWDFVLNPKTKQVVLGQRAELIFDGNGGTFDGENTDTKDYTFYSSEDPFADKTDMKAEKTPTKEGYQFVGWAEDRKAAFESADAYLDANIKKFDDNKSYMSLQAKQTGPITDILNPHTKTVYALWVKQIDISVNKVWGEGTKVDQKQEVKLTLTGGTATASLTLNEANKWSGKFEKVDTIAVNGGTDGKDAKITNYGISEAAIDGFTSKTTGNATAGFTVTNTPIKETVDISVTKAWQDESGKDGTPTGVTATIKLLADGADAKKTLTFTGNGTQKFENLPKKNDEGADIVYTISEETLPGYENPVITGNATDGFTVTNKKTPETVDISVKKNWADTEESDKVPVTITLKANDKATDKTVILNANNQWTASFKGLAKKDESGKVITYTVTEKAVEGFTSAVTGDATSGFTVTNTKDKPTPKPEEKVNIQVTKNWVGAEASDKVDVVVNLLANGQATDKSVTLNANNQWTATFEGLAKKDASGNAIAYTVTEKAVEGFTSAVTGDATSGFIVTNTKDKPTPKPEEKVNIQVKKVWSGAEESDKVPVTITLKANGDATNETVTLNAENQWTATFKDLAEKDENGKIDYTVSEIAVKGYTSTVTGDVANGFTITNTKDQPTPPTPEEKIITRYVDSDDHNLIPQKDGKHPKETIPGYEFVRTVETKEENKTIIRHIYKKIQEPVHPGGSVLILPTSGTSEPVPDDGLLNKKDHKAYMFGYPDGNFLPERNMTREEATAMFARLLKDYPRERRSYNIPFKDVAESDWSQQAIGFMLEKGMIQGYEDGSFRPKAAISRAEFAAMAAHLDKLMAGGGNSFFDVPAGHWAQGAIDSAAAKGWVTGYPDGSFKPERKITRAEVVNITNKMLDRFADRDFVRSHLAEMIQFKDLTEAEWAYFPIMEATNGHDYTRKAAQEENWIRLNGEEFRFVVGRK